MLDQAFAPQLLARHEIKIGLFKDLLRDHPLEQGRRRGNPDRPSGFEQMVETFQPCRHVVRMGREPFKRKHLPRRK